MSQFISCQLMVICRLTRPIQNLCHPPPLPPPADSSGLGWESKRRCSDSTSVSFSTTPSAPPVLVSSTQTFGLAAVPGEKAHSPSRFFFFFSLSETRRRPPRVTPVNTECLPADSCALPNYQILKSAVTHPHFSSRFILRGKGAKKLAAD